MFSSQFTSLLKRVTMIGFMIVLASILAACGLQNQGGRSTGSGDHAVKFINNTGMTICYLFVSPSTDSEWGEDRLGESGILDNGSDFTVRVQEAGSYDLLAVTENSEGNCDSAGEQLTQQGFNISGEVSWTVTR